MFPNTVLRISKTKRARLNNNDMEHVFGKNDTVKNLNLSKTLRWNNKKQAKLNINEELIIRKEIILFFAQNIHLTPEYQTTIKAYELYTLIKKQKNLLGSFRTVEVYSMDSRAALIACNSLGKKTDVTNDIKLNQGDGYSRVKFFSCETQIIEDWLEDKENKSRISKYIKGQDDENVLVIQGSDSYSASLTEHEIDSYENISRHLSDIDYKVSRVIFTTHPNNNEWMSRLKKQVFQMHLDYYFKKKGKTTLKVERGKFSNVIAKKKIKMLISVCYSSVIEKCIMEGITTIHLNMNGSREGERYDFKDYKEYNYSEDLVGS